MEYVKKMNAPECSASELVQWRTEPKIFGLTAHALHIESRVSIRV
jgi:hypothetical protein